MIRDERVFTGDVPATAPDQIQAYHEYSNTQKMMRPERLRAVWCREDGAPWHLSLLIVTGSVIKKNGTVGQAPQDSQFYRWGRPMQDIPEWLSAAINSAQPEPA